MNFEEQTPEMKQVFLCASIGEVSMEAHALELQLNLALCLLNSNSDAEFERECKKIRTLSPILDELKAKNIFSARDFKALEEAKHARNDFTHRLSEACVSNIKSGSSKFELIQHFREMKETIRVAMEVAESKMQDIAKDKGLDVNGLVQSAKEHVDKWSLA
ncbi:MAG TPA: hypothetical protein PKZ52_16015 [Cellvibrionaceae bacterium]|nr:hypothetical protein [Cellvibrionaceae bacterium]